MTDAAAADARDEEAARRALGVVTLILQGSLTGGRQLVAEDEDQEALAFALAMMVMGQAVVLARHHGVTADVWWKNFALKHQAFSEWWKDNGPTL